MLGNGYSFEELSIFGLVKTVWHDNWRGSGSFLALEICKDELDFATDFIAFVLSVRVIASAKI